MADVEPGGSGESADHSPQYSRAKPMVIGCGVGLAVAVGLAALLTIFGKAMTQAIVDPSPRAAAEKEYARTWNAPPETADIAAFSPEPIGDYALKRVDQAADFPAFHIELPGYHVVYEKGDDELVDVSVYRLDKPEKEALFDQVETLVDNQERFPKAQFHRSAHVFDIQIESPPLSGRFWYGQGWLIFFRSHSEPSLGSFSRAYLGKVGQAVANPSPPEAS